MKDVDVEAVFLHPDEPALEFEGFLRKKYPRVRYFQVSISLFFVFFSTHLILQYLICRVLSWKATIWTGCKLTMQML